MGQYNSLRLSLKIFQSQVVQLTKVLISFFYKKPAIYTNNLNIDQNKFVVPFNVMKKI